MIKYFFCSFKQVYETGLDIHHVMVENVIKKMELIEQKFYDSLNSNTDPDYETSNRIKFDEFFRNDFMVLIFGFSFALIVFIIEILFFYLNSDSNRPYRSKTQYNWIKLNRPRYRNIQVNYPFYMGYLKKPRIRPRMKIVRHNNQWLSAL